MKNHFFILLFSIFIFSCGERTKPVSHPTKWEAVIAKDQSVPTQRHEAGFINIDDKFYLLGGRGILPVNIFDIQTQKWTVGAKPPFTMHHFQPVVFDQKIYIVGAFTGNWPAETPVEHVYIYDPGKDEWIKSHAIPEERRRGSTGNVVYKDKIYIACGIKNGHIDDHKKWLDVYDPKTGEWEVLPDAPRVRDHFQAVLAEDKIFAPAGRLSNNTEKGFDLTIGEVDVFDITTNSWSTLEEEIPTRRAGNMALLKDNHVVVAGGESGTQIPAHAEVEGLNVTTQKWTSFPSMLQGRHGTGLILHQNHFYVASGCGNRGGSPELTTMEKLKFE